MSAESSRLRSWLKRTPNRREPTGLKLGCERLEDRLTPSGAGLPLYLPPTEFLLNQSQVAAPGASPLAIATGYLNANASQFGLSPRDLDNIRVTDQYRDANTGMSHIYFRQIVNGLEVENANFNVTVTANGRVFTAGGGFVAGLAKTLASSGPVVPALTPTAAVERAAVALGIAAPGQIQLITPPSGIDYTSVVSAPGVSLDNITARLHYVPTVDGSAALTWQLIIRTTDRDHWYDLSISDSTGAMLTQADWSNDATYRVLAMPTSAPDDGGFTVLTNPADPVASPFGWHDTNGVTGAEFNDTRGNNVNAHLDLNGDNIGDADQGGQTRPNGGAALDFTGFVFNPAVGADTVANRNVAQLNLFYAVNTIHDVTYRYGFTEVAGNFQTNNYGLGGLSGDAVEADAQDDFNNGTANNANFQTPPDGTPGRMQQYIFDLTTPTRDSDLANDVIFHEFGHGISNRLTGGPSNSSALTALQSTAMGEGWGDIYTLMLTQRPSDIQNGAFPTGTYVLGQPVTGPGVRRYPYSFDMAINPLTFDAFGSSGTTPYGTVRTTQRHDAGEIWASALWDLNWLLINKYGYDSDLSTGFSPGGGAASAGNKLTLALVSDGMKLQPANPSFIDARDAIMAADIALNGGADIQEIWAAFARRGLGFRASTTDADSDIVIIDTTVPVSVGITSDGNVVEGDSGATFATFTVTIEANPNVVTVNYSTFDDTATAADGDYVPVSGTLTFAAGTTTQTITVQVNGDTNFEGDESFGVALSSPTVAFIRPGFRIAIAVIINDDSPPPKPDVHTVGVATTGGVVAEVRGLNPATSSTRWAVRPFDRFAGAVTIAVGDVNNDGFQDVIVGAGPSAGPRIVVLSGQDGKQLASFFAFSQSFAGGVTVASADFNGDGYADIVVGADTRGGSHVKVFDGRTLQELRSFFAFGRDFNFGVRVAAGDVNGDGTPDVLVGAGGGAPVYSVFDGVTGGLIRRGTAFAPAFTGGIYIAAGDVDGDGFSDVILGAGRAGNPHVKVFSGLNETELASFFVNEDFSPNSLPSIPFESGISVSASDLDGDGIEEILTSKGRGTRSVLRSFRVAHRDGFGNVFATGLQQIASTNVFPGYFGGITVAGT